MTHGTASRNLGRRSRQLRLLGVATIAAGMVVAVGQSGPVGAATSSDAGLRSFCEEVAKRPPTEGIEQTTDPATGAPLQAGQTVKVNLRWDKAEFGSELERVAHCIVTLDGKVRLDLSGSEAPSANDGEYRGSFVVPAELAPGDCLCVLGVVAGDSSDGGSPLRLGGNSCVTVTKPAPPAPSPPTPAPPAASAPDQPGTDVLGASQERPSPAVPVAGGPMPLAELPRTGPFDTQVLLALAGLALVLGGGAITTRR
ncbi:MAG TPA: LPXTG cell wall anchor domain-containing protein [Acidimicrobiia bacterium]|nr:LPXTG cell wall anchor domain-containing protein [Acidimicrobiia bacterium]